LDILLDIELQYLPTGQPARTGGHEVYSTPLLCSQYYNITRPLLFSPVILKNEKDVLNFAEIIGAELELSAGADPPQSQTRDDDNPLDEFVTGLMKIVNALFNTHNLGLYLYPRPLGKDKDARYGRLPKDFWKIQAYSVIVKPCRISQVLGAHLSTTQQLGEGWRR
jgi:hypothetical protein